MKEADRKIINRIMDSDQRIIFVQTCKGAVVEQKFGGEAEKSVEEQLVEYRDRFKRAISPYENLKDAPIVQVETTEAMESFKTRDKGAWVRSGLDELISLRKAAEISGLSQSFWRRLVSQGDVWGVKVGRNWVTTETAVKEYLARDRKRGPKPK